MTITVASARPPLSAVCGDTLRALAEASLHAPASPSLVARLNPVHGRPATLHALEELHRSGLVIERPHPLTALLGAYALSPAGRAWVRRHG